MSATFATLVENLRSCSTEEKLELKSVLERALIDERRRELAPTDSAACRS